MPVRKNPRAKEKSPDISIITVCFQAAPALEKTLLNVASEGRPHLEHIIVDGGSTDHTLAVLKKHRAKIAKSVSEPDHGIYHAMNKGVALARGRWLLFLNAGDTLYPGMLAQFFAVAEAAAPDTALVCGRANMTDPLGKKPGHIHPTKTGDTATLERRNCVSHQAALIRKSTFERYGLYSQAYAISGDHEYWIRLLKAGARFLFTDLVLAEFPQDGISTRPSAYLEIQRASLLIRAQYGYRSLPGAGMRFLWLVSTLLLKKTLRRVLGRRVSKIIRRAVGRDF